MFARSFQLIDGVLRGSSSEVSMCVRPARGVAQRSSQIALAALLLGALAAPAQAQLTNAPVDLQIFRPAMDSKGFITLNSSGVLAPGDLSFGLVTTWASKPLTLTAGNVGTPPMANRFQVGDIVTPSLQAAVGIAKLS